MKRLGNLFTTICSVANLDRAERKARRGKRNNPAVKEFDKDRPGNLLALHHMLINKTYRTSPYTTFPIFEPKERLIFRLPYYPDRIVHHAIMIVLEQMFVSTFTADTYSCIKGKGIHGAKNALEKALKDVDNTTYCLKLDIKKFYPNIDHDILKWMLRRKIKDTDLLELLDEIIDSAPGVPIGNYLSQYFANFYLTYFDHWLKEVKGIRYYFRYADDIVILSSNKQDLHQILADIKQYLGQHLKLEVKGNYQVFPVAARGIDFVGYVFFHTHILLRKSIKQRFARMMAYNPNSKSLASYRGWTNHCNSYNLLKKLTHANTTLQRLKCDDLTRKRRLRREKERNGRRIRPADNNTRLQGNAF